MDSISYTSFRNKLATTLDKVNEDHRPILITRKNGKEAVVMSLEDFKSYEETFYLLSSPKNAKRLNQSIQQLESGNGIRKDILDK